jgi:hypothetical protein
VDVENDEPESKRRSPVATEVGEFGSDFDPVRSFLEDFVPLNGDVAVRHSASAEFVRNIRAAHVASLMGVSSVDRIRKKYAKEFAQAASTQDADGPLRSYIDAYHAGKSHVFQMLCKLRTDGRPDPTAGQLTASVALQRLSGSFFSAHLLYRLGHRHEGHAVSRLILEQIAWAYAVHSLADIEQIARVVTTRSISSLRKFAPEAGRLYGFLSEKTHIDFSVHDDFVRVIEGRGAILYTHREYIEFADVILELADLFGAVWEVSQQGFLDSNDSIAVGPGVATLRCDRPFLSTKRLALDAVEAATREQLESTSVD